MSIVSSFLRLPAISQLTRVALHAMDAETAHRATISALKAGLVPRGEANYGAELATQIAGIQMPNPVGMAAGFDKNAETVGALHTLGFGFAEVGTVTPLPQSGNPQPRLFRISEKKGVINRMGFNNEGHEAVYKRLAEHRQPGIFGVNIGANKTSDDFVADYVRGVQRFSAIANYLTANISSPNTPGLRGLQNKDALTKLLGEIANARSALTQRKPVFLKIAPDLDETEMDDIAEVLLQSDIDGLIVSNTTLARTGVEAHKNAAEAGGLSGKPLFEISTQRLAQMRLRLGPDFPIIGTGGVYSARSALAKFEAGANAIQLYSALVFGGFEMLDEILSGLSGATRLTGEKNISALVSANVNDWAAGKATL